MFTSILYAEEQATAQATSPVGGLVGLMPIVLMFVILYFLMIRPQQKRQKEVAKMRDELKKNDKVITNGGIIGTVYSIKGDVVVVKVDDNVKIEFTKSAIMSKVQ